MFTEIGVALTTFGGLFMFLGVMFLFDGALLALGNILFVSGLALIIGPQKTVSFFARKQKIRGSICFFGGILLIFLKWPFFGMLIETFGFLNLFGDFFPVVISFLRQLPFIGTLLSLPGVAGIPDQDPFSSLLEDDDAPGVLIRTDYSNDEAWDAFYLKLKDAEREILESLTPPPAEEGVNVTPPAEPSSSSSSSIPTGDVDMKDEGGDGDESDGGSSDSGALSSVIRVINPTNPEERRILENIANIAALRLFNDVDLRPAPPRAAGTKKIQPPNPLIDQNDWQEIYTGKTIWIYDDKSVRDECVRLVSPAGDFYGTATGDSWRARVSHICELQFNMSFLGMKIDFGGLDRWDFPERERNVREAVRV
ncbi:hypothetical protein EST38_g2517 [Candolleomyces aberdarensis]|uniref:Uncharacterized protein n=1 Tax=Candolleomyces aberdarensis TaxID=2316362 RepID=A0A4Q2DSQ7_9AGAR|nr:hypothetical protein EST38_g2517 [Candolleomyces aberdarensis]